MHTFKSGTGHRQSIDFKADKASQTAPVIVETITDDDGTEMYVLENGNLFPKLRYDALWFPVKTKIKPKNFRDPYPGSLR